MKDLDSKKQEWAKKMSTMSTHPIPDNPRFVCGWADTEFIMVFYITSKWASNSHSDLAAFARDYINPKFVPSSGGFYLSTAHNDDEMNKKSLYLFGASSTYRGFDQEIPAIQSYFESKEIEVIIGKTDAYREVLDEDGEVIDAIKERWHLNFNSLIAHDTPTLKSKEYFVEWAAASYLSGDVPFNEQIDAMRRIVAGDYREDGSKGEDDDFNTLEEKITVCEEFETEMFEDVLSKITSLAESFEEVYNLDR